MEFEDIVVKESPGLCRCCLSEGCYKDLGSEYTWMNETEVYADMLLECFDLGITRHNDGPNGPNRLICEVCITRLRDACNFKKQVLDSEKKFIDMVARGEFRPKMVIYQAQLKSECIVDANIEDDAEYLEDDVDLGDDDYVKDESANEPTVSALPVKRKRGRPSKNSTVAKTEKKTKVAKNDDKPKTSKAVAKDSETERTKNSGNYHRRRNLRILFNNTTLIPFKWRRKYVCFFCGEDCYDRDMLVYHTQKHGLCCEKDRPLRLVKAPDSEIKIDVSDINCLICSESFLTFEDIVDHLIDKHSLPYNKDVKLMVTTYRLVDLRCLICSKQFTFLAKLITHMNTEHPIDCFQCHKCEQKFNKKRDLGSHLRTFHKSCHPCVKCDLSFPTRSALQAHRTTAHLSSCNICFQTFTTDVKRLKHMTRDHSSEETQCGFCYKVMTTKQSLLRHAAKCYTRPEAKDGTIIVDDNDKKENVKELRASLATIVNMSTALPFKYFMNRFRCFYCSKDFSKCEELKEHMILQHPVCDMKSQSMRLRNRYDGVNIKMDVSTLSCKLCYESLRNLNDVVDHLTTEHKAQCNKAILSNLQAFSLIHDNFACPFCGEMYRYFGLLLKHISTNHTDNKYICVYCGVSFRTDPSLRAHVRHRHKNVGQFKCKKCELAFPSPTALKIHMGAAHGSKVVKCSECLEKFITQYSMQRHMLTVHGRGHKCSYCGKLFIKYSFMMNHLRRLHLKEKNVECSLCYEKFFDEQRLRMHMVKHVGERNFHCDICGKKFLYKRNLRGHMSSHLKNVNMQINMNNDCTRGTYDYSGSDGRRSNLVILFNHTTILPFKWRGKFICFYCGLSFTDYPDFKKHTQSHVACSVQDYALKKVKGNDVEIKIDVSEILCEDCNEPFNKYEEIIDHLIEKHNLSYNKDFNVPLQEYRLVDLKCLHCEQQFNYFGALVSHVNNTHPRKYLICDDCGCSFNKKRDLACHIRNYHRVGGYPCLMCPQTFASNHSLRAHTNNTHFRRCLKCGSLFGSLSSLQKHIAEEHPFPTEGNIKCSYCSREFHSSLGLKNHLPKCKVKSVAQDVFSDDFEANANPVNNSDFQQIRKNIVCILNMSTAVPFKYFSKYWCFYCSRKFTDFEELRRHTKSEHTMCDISSRCIKRCKGTRVRVNLDISNLTCKLCDFRTPDIDTLIDHLNSNHNANYDKTVKNCFECFKITKDGIPCPLCPDKLFRYFVSLQRHMNSEHNDNYKVCDFCGRGFRNNTNLHIHIGYMHTGDCECDVCGLKLKNNACLQRHKAKVHDAKEYKCSKCSELFPSPYQKQIHQIKVHNIGHKCSYCGRMFTRNSFMVDHVRRTHLKEKTVPCTLCNYMFFDNYLLKRHMAKHDGERKFKCTICDKAFIRRSNLNVHMKIHKKYGHEPPEFLISE